MYVQISVLISQRNGLDIGLHPHWRMSWSENRSPLFRDMRSPAEESAPRRKLDSRLGVGPSTHCRRRCSLFPRSVSAAGDPCLRPPRALNGAHSQALAAQLHFGGAVAQLGERLVRNEEVRGSTPLGSTS